MKRLLPLLLIALVAGACGSSTPSESPSASPSTSPVAEVSPTPVPTPVPSPLADVNCAPNSPSATALLPTTIDTLGIGLTENGYDCSVTAGKKSEAASSYYPSLSAWLPTVGKTWDDVRFSYAGSDSGFGSVTLSALRVSGVTEAALLAWYGQDEANAALILAPVVMIGEKSVHKLVVNGDAEYLWVMNDTLYYGLISKAIGDEVVEAIK